MIVSFYYTGHHHRLSRCNRDPYVSQIGAAGREAIVITYSTLARTARLRRCGSFRQMLIRAVAGVEEATRRCTDDALRVVQDLSAVL
jgi:hypothetical protein